MVSLILQILSNAKDQEYMIWLYEEYSPVMYSTAHKYAGNPSACDDIVQDSLIRLMNKLVQLRTFESNVLSAYIAVTVRNTALNESKRARRQRSYPVEPDELPSPALSGDELVDVISLRGQLSKALNALSEDDRYLLIGKYLIGYTDREMAAVLKCKPSSIRMMLTRARRRAMHLMKLQESDPQ